jgi:hypothetical protein
MSELVTKYREFITFLMENVNKERKKNLEVLKKKDISVCEENVSTFVELINENDKYQKYLLNQNKKLFALNKNIGLVDFAMKNVYKKMNNETKTNFWEFLQIIYVLANKDNDNMEYNIKLLNKLEKSTIQEEVVEADDLELNLADKMIRDIAESFDSAKTKGNSKDAAINNIIQTSQAIGEKYRKDLESGELSFGDMINSFQKLAEQLDENDDDEDEEFDSTMLPTPDELLEKLVPGGFEGEQMKSMFKNMESMLSGAVGAPSGAGAGANPLSMMGSLFGMNNNNNKVEADALTEQQLKELEEYYKEKGINLDELKKE